MFTFVSEFFPRYETKLQSGKDWPERDGQYGQGITNNLISTYTKLWVGTQGLEPSRPLQTKFRGTSTTLPEQRASWAHRTRANRVRPERVPRVPARVEGAARGQGLSRSAAAGPVHAEGEGRWCVLYGGETALAI